MMFILLAVGDKAMLQSCSQVNGGRLLVLGLTFKENCPDLRNSRVVDVISELEDFGITVDVHNPIADLAEAKKELGIELVVEPNKGAYDGVIPAVAYDAYTSRSALEMRDYCKPTHVLFDLKSTYDAGDSDARL